MNAYAKQLHSDAPRRRTGNTLQLAEMFAAARALDDCSVIRARFNAKGYARLSELGLAYSRPAGNWKADFRLTPQGVIWLSRNRASRIAPDLGLPARGGEHGLVEGVGGCGTEFNEITFHPSTDSREGR